MVSLPSGEKFWILVLTEFTKMTDRRTDTAWRHRPRLHIIAWQKSTRRVQRTLNAASNKSVQFCLFDTAYLLVFWDIASTFYSTVLGYPVHLNYAEINTIIYMMFRTRHLKSDDHIMAKCSKNRPLRSCLKVVWYWQKIRRRGHVRAPHFAAT